MSVEIVSPPGHSYPKGETQWQLDLFMVLKDVLPRMQKASSVLTNSY